LCPNLKLLSDEWCVTCSVHEVVILWDAVA